jgi:hypothetical protein
VSSPTDPTDDPGPSDHNGENPSEQLIARFAAIEARQVLQVTRWFLYAAVAAVGIEILVTYLEQFPKLIFVTIVLDLLGKLILSCDAILIAVFVVVATILALNTLLMIIQIDVAAFVRWTGRQIAIAINRKGGNARDGIGASPALSHDSSPLIDHDSGQAPSNSIQPGDRIPKPAVAKVPVDENGAGM